MGEAREWFSQFGSGLEHLWGALQYRQDPKIKDAVLALSIRCLVLQTIFSLIAAIVPGLGFRTLSQLFYPAVLLYRYIQPDAWDKLFTSAVRRLGCSERSDVVAKSSPEHLTQLKRYCSRTLKAFIGIGALQWLVNRKGLFSLPSQGLALLVVDQALQYKGFSRTFWKLVLLSLFTGPRLPVWAVQTFVLQQLLMYELLQPYLARVSFKGWEERAWLAQYDVELQGFAFGAWVLCSIPWIGVAAIPFLFPAVAFLLTRSCGSLENSGHGGDVIERRNPGVKSVALGKSKSVEGDWEEPRVRTLVRIAEKRDFAPKTHSKGSGQKYSSDDGVDRPATEEQIQADKELSRRRKLELYKEARLHFRGPNWDASHFSHPHAQPDASFGPQTRGAEGSTSVRDRVFGSEEDFTKYNFSDRKNNEAAPSAPPVPSGDLIMEQEDVYRVQALLEDPNALLAKAHENKILAMEAKIRAKEQKRAAKEIIMAATEARWAPHTSQGSSLGGIGTLETTEPVGDVTDLQENREDKEDAHEVEEEDEAFEDEGKDEIMDPKDNTPWSSGLQSSSSGALDSFRGRGRDRDWRGGWGGGWGGRTGRGGWGHARGVARGRGHYWRGMAGASSSQYQDIDNDVPKEGPGLSFVISQSVQNIEQQMSQQLEGWGTQLMQRLRDAVVDPDNPQHFKIKFGGSTG